MPFTPMGVAIHTGAALVQDAGTVVNGISSAASAAARVIGMTRSPATKRGLDAAELSSTAPATRGNPYARRNARTGVAERALTALIKQPAMRMCWTPSTPFPPILTTTLRQTLYQEVNVGPAQTGGNLGKVFAHPVWCAPCVSLARPYGTGPGGTDTHKRMPWNTTFEKVYKRMCVTAARIRVVAQHDEVGVYKNAAGDPSPNTPNPVDRQLCIKKITYAEGDGFSGSPGRWIGENISSTTNYPQGMGSAASTVSCTDWEGQAKGPMVTRSHLTTGIRKAIMRGKPVRSYLDAGSVIQDIGGHEGQTAQGHGTALVESTWSLVDDEGFSLHDVIMGNAGGAQGPDKHTADTNWSCSPTSNVALLPENTPRFLIFCAPEGENDVINAQQQVNYSISVEWDISYFGLPQVPDEADVDEK